MRLLAIETTGALGSFAVVDGTESRAVGLVAGIDRDIMGRHVESSVSMVSEVLAEASLRLHDLDGIAVSLGPGSFTGLRVGLGIAKGLCVGAGLPLVGVPTLDCLARPLRDREGLIVTARDARRGEVYCALYRPAGESLERVTGYMSLAPGGLLSEIAAAREGVAGPVTLVGDGIRTYGDIFGEIPGEVCLAPEALWNVKASVVGAIGIDLMSAGRTLDLDTAEPIYARLSEAERKRAGPSGPGNKGK
jgi:tRNA threonylcarbamoyl adenosine modification protein YeaZ